MTKNLKDLGLSTRVYNTLTKAGIETVEQLTVMTFDELKSIKGISDKSAEEIQSKLAVADVVETVVEKTPAKKVKNSKEVSFKENTTYIFTKKKYIRSEGRKSYQANREFVNKLNGRVVDVATGTIDGKPVCANWCIVK